MMLEPISHNLMIQNMYVCKKVYGQPQCPGVTQISVYHMKQTVVHLLNLNRDYSVCSVQIENKV